MKTIHAMTVSAVLALGCAKPESAPPPHSPADTAATAAAGSSLANVPAVPTASPSPWSGPRISRDSIPWVYQEVWRVAENKSNCALLAVNSLSADVAGGTPRKATFSGGWAVAYDLPEKRSAFGVAGSGSDAWSPDTYAQWPENITWSDGSTAGYGPEAGAGPDWLAYVKIPGQQCLYNVWSKRGKSELEAIIQSLRFVDTEG